MRRALLILSMVAVIASEAPYHLPRPAQSFQYHSAPAPILHEHAIPAPVAVPQFPPQQQYSPNIGYNYPAPAPQYIQPASVHPHPPPPPPSPPPAHHHHHHHHPAPAPVYVPQQGLQPLPVASPQPLPLVRPQPLPVIQPHPQPQPIYSPPSSSYGVPIDVRSVPQSRLPVQHAPAPVPIQALPVFAPQPVPQPQLIQQVYQQPIAYYQQQQQQQQQYSEQQYSQQGYNYQQPTAVAQFQPQIQTLQTQLFEQSAPALSSYQADSNQYNSAQEQTHRDALDSIVVSRVQNVIKDDEHSVARNAGYLSLVSGVSLEQAKPSVELTSFTHTSPAVISAGVQSDVSASSISSAASSSVAAPSADYGVPSAPAPVPVFSQSADSTSSFNFLPQSKPAISYGPPN